MTTTVLAYIPSPSQGVWEFFGVPLRAYALFIIVGIIAAMVIGDRRWVARGGEPGVIYDVALWAVPFGLIGGRVYHVLTDWSTYFGDDGAGFAAALRIWDGGLGIWGAVALGGIGAWIACRRHGIPLPAFGDAIAPGIILAQAIGRLGNYFNQELFGRPTTLPWGLEIYERRNAAGVLDTLNGVSTGQLIEVVHPTFLYELLWNLLVFAVLIIVDRKFRIGHGRLFALYVAGYCVGRFWIELMRSDAATLLAGVRVNSFTSTFVFIGAVVYIMVAPKGREDPATLKGRRDAEAGEAGEVEDFVKGLAVGASTTGVVAAAKVAGEDDERSVVEAAEAETLTADVEEPAESGHEVGGLGSVEGDEAVEAADGASAAHDAAVMGEADAKALAAAVEVEPEASEVEVDEAAESAEPAEGAPPELATEAGGLGSVEGDEAVEAAEGASVAHDSVVVDEAAAASAHVDSEVTEEPETEPAGLGAVDGDEAAEAAEDASVAHEVAVEGEVAAEALATDVGAEEAEAEEPDAEEPEAEGADTDAEGLGSVEGDEVAEAVADAPEAHEVAAEGASVAEALAAEVEEPGGDDEDSDSVAEEVDDTEDEAVTGDADESETAEADTDAEGLGSVEGDEVAEAVADAPEAHEVAAEGASVAEALAAEVEEPGGDDEDSDSVAEEVDDTEAAVSADGDDSEDDEVAADGAPAAEVPAAEAESDENAADSGVRPEQSETSAAKPGSESSPESAFSSSVLQSGGKVRQWLRRRRNR
ncbi:prolipoprotein diacylglyceryl transferase [Mycolicibacterium pyrenivorans]|uniref:prolipoprotein diacylglyceryl transferase n=1 Tax=Mycolicibacterium pyrenivorans TaxID=187102 RepID=UPI0021F263DE|nr:prolipoprotein diacylglyceryl transferase [Mycolicibacterium pyrenivorans]MCV7153178.1 prolipoprotein diacylglyceryl transferase [Mycolicibacterium pyrenivorans]